MSIHDDLATMEQAIARIRAALPSDVTTVKAGADLQKALDTGGTVELEAGVVFEAQAFVLTKPTRLMFQPGAQLHGASGPGFYVKPGTTDIYAEGLQATSEHQAAIQLGDNGPTQSRLDDVPRRIHLVRPVVPSHHGKYAKNGIENNAADVAIEDAQISDVFNPGAVESHCLISINTPGGLRLLRGTWSGASTPLFSGGDAIDIPDTDIGDVVYDSLTITRPLAWQTDGLNRNIKNLIEFKNVTHALVTNCDLSNSWGPIQRGFAVMLTPKVDGRVVDVELNGNRVSNVGGFCNITGRNPTGLDPTRTDDIRIVNNWIALDKNAFGPSAYGWFLLLQDGPGHIVVEGNTVTHNGNAFIVVDDRDPIESLIVRGNTFNAGVYGIKTPFGNNGDGWQQVFRELIVEDNTITGAAAAFKRNFPKNVYA